MEKSEYLERLPIGAEDEGKLVRMVSRDVLPSSRKKRIIVGRIIAVGPDAVVAWPLDLEGEEKSTTRFSRLFGDSLGMVFRLTDEEGEYLRPQNHDEEAA